MSAWHEIWHPDLPVWSLIVRAAAVYVAVIFLLRVSGKRQIAQMGMVEFVALLLISNAVQNSMNGGDNSLAGGLILAATLIVVATAFEWAQYRSKKFENLVQGRPTLLVHHGHLLKANFRKEKLTLREFGVILRKQGIHDVNEVSEAVLESDGYVSVLKKSDLADGGHTYMRDVRQERADRGDPDLGSKEDRELMAAVEGAKAVNAECGMTNAE